MLIPMVRIARVVVDLALDREFDYLVPDELAGEARLGSRVLVPFGHRRVHGYIVGFADSSSIENLKPIERIVGRKPLVEERILELARWIADYYMAPLEKAVQTVLPGAVRKPGARFKETRIVSRTEKADDALAVAELRKKAPAQGRVLDALAGGPMPLERLAEAAQTAAAAVHALVRKGFAAIASRAVLRMADAGHEVVRTEPLPLMPQQQEALAAIVDAIEGRDKRPVLLHGVTGSGKTEVYLQAIDRVLKEDRGCIVLVPEISLTPQTVDRFRGRFGETVAVLHSELSEGERHDEWHRIHDGLAKIAIGPRSAVFAPVRRLGLIVVDEEHEHTYKQEETPRYNARDVAVVRAHMEQCAVVLGSATPSLESYRNAQIGKYRLVRMPHRVDHREMPVMRIVDLRQDFEKEGRLYVLSRDLKEAIHQRLARAEQVILFLNRRGFASSLICPLCGAVAKCRECSVALTYHKTDNCLLCHICGARYPVPETCPQPDCRHPGFRFAGVGTQRVEEALKKVFPHARIARMDSDSMTRKNAYRETLGAFRAGRIDILVGTQMIAKGLDFPGVTLVGVVLADLTLHQPDFRAGERTFQLLVQVAGRAGRGDKAGEVIVQTFTPFHPAIQAARRLDYDGFAAEELEFRQELGYPPCLRMAVVTARGPLDDLVQLALRGFAARLRERAEADVQIIGPAPAPLAKSHGEYRHQLILKAEKSRRITRLLKAALDEYVWPDEIAWSIDVDPLSLL